MTDPTNAPEGQPPAAPVAPAAPDYGASPEVIQQALNLYNGLNNLDTRGQYLQQVVRPDIDGQFIRQMVEPQQPAPDPYAQFMPQEYITDEQYMPQEQQFAPYAPPFDPHDFAQTLKQDVSKTIFDQLGEMAQQQQVTESAKQAAQSAGIPESLASMIEARVRDAQKLQPNRQIGELANEHAKAIAAELMAWKATPAETPPPASAPPSGPAPSLDEGPKDLNDIDYWQQRLR